MKAANTPYISLDGYFLNLEDLDDELYRKPHSIRIVEDILELMNADIEVSNNKSEKLLVANMREQFILLTLTLKNNKEEPSDPRFFFIEFKGLKIHIRILIKGCRRPRRFFIPSGW